MIYRWGTLVIMKADVSDIHRLEVVVLESESIGVAKLSEDLPCCLLPPSLDEQLVQKEKSYKGTDINSILGWGGREGGREGGRTLPSIVRLSLRIPASVLFMTIFLTSLRA